MYRNFTDFSVYFVFCTITKFFISFNSFFQSSTFSLYKGCYLQTDSFTSSSSICMHLIFNSCLIAFSRISCTMFNRNDESGYAHLGSDFRKIGFNLSQLSMMSTIGLLYSFIMLVYMCPTYTNLSGFFFSSFFFVMEEC